MIPIAYHDLLDAPNTALLASLLPDGSPQNSPVWFWFDGTTIAVSTTKDRQKHRNLVRDPRVSFTVVDPVRPLRYLEVRGVTVISDDEGLVLRDQIARKHGFADGSRFDAPDAQRVAIRITPTRVIEH